MVGEKTWLSTSVRYCWRVRLRLLNWNEASPRSLVATLTFMGTGALTVLVMRHFA